MRSVIKLSPLTRVEGHGRIFVYLDGKRVERVQLSLSESPRLFEALLKGKDYREVPEIICRICSLCSTVHRVAALQAIEKALEVRVSDQARLYRELILYGGHIQSHSLHLFCLVLPDHAEAAGIADLAVKAPEELKMGLRIKAAGNLIQETVGGRLIHPVTLVTGGMLKPPGREGLRKLRADLAAILPDAWQAYRMFAAFPPESGILPTHPFLAISSGTDFSLFGNRLECNGNGSFPVEEYRKMLDERVVPHSHAKSSTIGGKPVIVGALARLNRCSGLAPKAAEAFQESRAELVTKDIRANNLAQAVELIHAVERSIELVDTLIESNFTREPGPEIAPCMGTGTATIEAPRGVLIHSYSFDSAGSCTAADIITPTAINQAAMEQDLLILARTLEGADEHKMTAGLERLVRAYDPCISCAVHVVRLSEISKSSRQGAHLSFAGEPLPA